MFDRNAMPADPSYPTCQALRELANAAAEVVKRAGELERFASSLRTSSERLTSRSTQAAVDRPNRHSEFDGARDFAAEVDA